MSSLSPRRLTWYDVASRARQANISSVDQSQATPMHAASSAGREDLVKLMLDHKLAEDEKLLRQIDVGDAD